MIVLRYIAVVKQRKKSGRMPNTVLEAAAALRQEVDCMIQAMATEHQVTYDNMYDAMGLHDPPNGREVNLWNLFTKVMRQDWAGIPENLGDNFTKKAHAAYVKATKGLDEEELEDLRKELTARAKTTAKKELNEATSMARILKVLKKAVCFCFSLS